MSPHVFPHNCVPTTGLVATAHLDKDVKAQVVNVVDVAQSKQASEKATGQHSHSEIQSNGQALSNNATTQGYSGKRRLMIS